MSTTEESAPNAARAACEAFWAAVGAGPENQEPTAAWEWAASQHTRRAWAHAAAAAIDANLTAADDGTLTAAGRLADVLGQLAGARAELARLKNGARQLGKIVAWQAQSMEAARIEMRQNGPEKAMQWILNSLPDVSDADPADQWDGTESATQWIDRVQAADKAHEAGEVSP